MRRTAIAVTVSCLCLFVIPTAASAISFEPPPTGATTGVGANPNWVATGDFNEDGRDDLAVTAADYGDDNEGLYVALSGGDGGFTVNEDAPLQAPIFGAGDKDMLSVRSADLNGDDHLDLLAAIAGASSFVTYLGDGEGDFEYHGRTFAQQGYMDHSAALGDVTNDGFPDLIIGYYGSRYSVAEGDGEGGFGDVDGMVTVPGSPGNALDGFTEIAIGDYNGDGKEDLALGLLPCKAGIGPPEFCTDPNPSMNAVFVVSGDSSGSFAPAPNGNPHLLAGGDSARLNSMATADLDGNSRDDLVVTSDDGQVQTFAGATSDFLIDNPDSNATLETGNQPGWVQVAKLDSGERLDLAWLNRGSATFGIGLAEGTGFLTATGSPFAGTETGFYSSMAAGDFNGDGFADLAATNQSEPMSILTLMNSPKLSADGIEFADQPVGSSSGPETVTLENLGAPAGIVSEVEIVGTDAGQFGGVDLETCQKSIAGGESCDIEISFSPTQPGSKEAVIEVTHTAGEPLEIPLTGFATRPEIEIDPSGGFFGDNVELGSQPPTRSMRVLSVGTAPLSLGDFTITGPDAAEFSIVDESCSGKAIDPGQACDVQLQMATGSAGPKSAQLRIPSDAGSGTLTTNLSGTVAEAPGPPDPDPPSGPTTATLRLKSPGKIKRGKKLKVTAIAKNTGSTTITGLALKTSLPKKFAKRPKAIQVDSLEPGVTVKKTIRIAVRKKARAGKKLKVTVTASASGKKLAAARRTVKIRK